MYGIPETMAKRGEYEEAIAAYEKIAKEYPNEIKPHAAMLEIALVALDDPARASDMYRHAIESLASEDARAVVTRRYSEFGSLRRTRHDRGKTEPVARHPDKTGASPSGDTSGS